MLKNLLNKPFGFYIFIYCLIYFFRNNLLKLIGYNIENLTFYNLILFSIVMLPWFLIINNLFDKKLIHNYVIKLLKLIIVIILFLLIVILQNIIFIILPFGLFNL